MRSDDTIVAQATASGVSSRAIIRLSGPSACSLFGVCAGLTGPNRTHVTVGAHAVPAWVYVFRGPRSSTGQDVVEVHLPGNPLLVRRLIDQCLARGVRAAEPGEFTVRAFLNGRLDLTAAEGVAATIAASSRNELDAAHRLLVGELATRLRPIRERVADLLALVEAGIDFTDQDIAFISDDHLAERLDSIDADIMSLLVDAKLTDRTMREPRVVLFGLPNAGKSTLFNALLGAERVVTSPVAGTTRDVVEAHLQLPVGRVVLMDVAGLEDHEPRDAIERQMRDRAVAAVDAADIAVLVRDASAPHAIVARLRKPDLVVLSKADLSGERSPEDALRVSAITGEGLDRLCSALNQLAFGTQASDASSKLAINARHEAHLMQVHTAITYARGRVMGESELIAHHLRRALDEIGAVVGEVTSDDVLGRVFSRFCIGK
jgi:tRNA modification GTPase